MATHFTLSDDQRDCLQEVINVAIGRAGDALARFLEVFVRLSVPHIQILEARELPKLIQSSQRAVENVSAVRQGFTGISRPAMRGEAVAIYSDASFHELAKLLGHKEETDGDISEAELLCDVSNILVGNCLGNIARQFNGEVVFSAPSPLLLQRSLHELTDQLSAEWDAALLVEIHYSLERGTFRCTLVLLMPTDVMVQLGAMIDTMLDAL